MVIPLKLRDNMSQVSQNKKELFLNTVGLFFREEWPTHSSGECAYVRIASELWKLDFYFYF